MRTAAKHIVFYLALIALWATVAKLRIWPPYLFPSPASVLESLLAGFSERSFWIGIAVSMRRIAIGYGIAVALGLLLGLLIASSKFLQETLGGLLVSLQSLPSVCWLPLAILWFGLSEKAILFVIVMGSLLSITLSLEAGRKQIPKIYAMAGRNLGASGVRLLLFVLLPASIPMLLAGLKQGWAFAWRSLIQGEMMFISLGLGQLLIMARDLNDISQVIAVMIVIVALGYLIDRLVFETFERRLQEKWGLGMAA
jgi:NitT/TauT family transport system permease protein